MTARILWIVFAVLMAVFLVAIDTPWYFLLPVALVLAAAHPLAEFLEQKGCAR